MSLLITQGYGVLQGSNPVVVPIVPINIIPANLLTSIVDATGKYITLTFDKPIPSNYRYQGFSVYCNGYFLPIEYISQSSLNTIVITVDFFILANRAAYVSYATDTRDGISQFSNLSMTNTSTVNGRDDEI